MPAIAASSYAPCDWLSVPQAAFADIQGLTKLAEDVRQTVCDYSVPALDGVYYAPGEQAAMILMKDGSAPPQAIFDVFFKQSIPVYLASQASYSTEEVWIPLLSCRSLPAMDKLAAAYEALDEGLATSCEASLMGRNTWADAPHKATKAANQGYSPTLRHLGELAGYLPGGELSWGIPGVPKHLQGLLGGGLLGAGLGYGAGYLGAQLLPKTWDRAKLPRTLAILGSISGASPGIATALSSLAAGTKGLSDDLLRPAWSQVSEYQPFVPNYVHGLESRPEFLPNPNYNPHAADVLPHGDYKRASDMLDAELGDTLHPIVKKAISETGYEIDFTPPPVPLDYMTNVLWNDPRVVETLPAPLRAATTGLLESAWLNRERTGDYDHASVRWVRPRDIAAITAGMGSGYLSGALIGKALGALVGMPLETQDKLKNIGLFSGIIANVIPLAFGR